MAIGVGGFGCSRLRAICLPVHSANVTQERNSDTYEQNSSAQNAAEPDTLTEYASEKIDTVEEGEISISSIAEEAFDPVESSTVRQAGELQGDAGLTGEYHESYYTY